MEGVPTPPLELLIFITSLAGPVQIAQLPPLYLEKLRALEQ